MTQDARLGNAHAMALKVTKEINVISVMLDTFWIVPPRFAKEIQAVSQAILLGSSTV